VVLMSLQANIKNNDTRLSMAIFFIE